MDLMTLVAKLTLDSSEYEKGLNNAENTAEKAGGGFGSKLAKGAKMAAKGMAAVGAAAGAATVKISKAAISGYADLEQLEGGIETLFGDSAKKVVADANNAFKTAGMSANQYMETSIQSAAAMINSLGGDQAKAAEMMNMSITDMSDNANKMGTTMESVQDAYRGFSRGNFTMLDNLALGYAGTKEGMQQLLDKAMEIEKQQGRNTQFSIDSYADIVQAIHIVQDEMGITGTTTAEAEKTISGSINAMKSAWQNLVTGFADDNADLDQLITNVVDSAETVFNNILPVVEKTLNGIGQFAEKIAPIIAEKLPEVFKATLPTLLESAMNFAASVVQALVTAFIETAPQIVEVGIQAVLQLAQGLAAGAPNLIESISEVVFTIVNTLLDNINLLIDAALQLAIGIATGLINALPTIVSKIPEIVVAIITALLKALPQFLNTGVQLIHALLSGIVKTATSIPKALVNAAKKAISAVKNIDWKSLGINIIKGIARGMLGSVGLIVDAARNAARRAFNAAKSFLGIQSPSKLFRKQIGENIGKGMALGIRDSESDVVSAMDALDDALATSDFTVPAVGVAEEPTDETTIDVLNTSDGASGSRIEDLLITIIETMQSMGVTIDGKALVGQLLPDIDRGLGSISNNKSREVAYV